MRLQRALLAVGASAAVQFLWHGLAQAFPWGTSVARNFSETSGTPYVASVAELQQAPPGTWTTPAFGEQFKDGISTLATDRSFAWVISVPREAYSLPRYFAVHALTQLGIAILLLLVLHLLSPLPRRRRLATLAVIGTTATVGVYGGMLNWLGMPPAFGIGQAFNHVAGWCAGFLILDRLLVRGAPHRATRTMPVP